ncbi:hypothetical protein QTP88_023228 [Uroleucon formosanum]
MCCNIGKTQLDPLQPPPKPLRSLLEGDHPDHDHFINYTRKHNSYFQMTSFGAKQIFEEGFMPLFKVQGQVYHLYDSLIPNTQENPQFLHIYFVGEDEKEVQLRCSLYPEVKQALIKQLQNMLHTENKYIRELKTTILNASQNNTNFQVVIHADRKPANGHKGCYNASTTNEVALVIVGQQFEKRDIIIQSHDNRLQRIKAHMGLQLQLHHQEVAATLLHGGKTAHSAFQLPLNLNTIEIPTCNINKQSNMANVLKKCKLIVWDESPMSHKKGFEALNNSLKDLRNSNLLMRVVTVLLAGDFRQTLPIVPRRTRANEIVACIKSSYLWPKIETFSLTKNMRVHLKGDKTAEQFSELLLKIGDGKYPECEEKITLPTGLGTVVNTLQELTYKIYPGIENLKEISMDWLCERAILTSKNDTVEEINKILLSSFQAKKNGIQIGEFGAGNR